MTVQERIGMLVLSHISTPVIEVLNCWVCSVDISECGYFHYKFHHLIVRTSIRSDMMHFDSLVLSKEFWSSRGSKTEILLPVPIIEIVLRTQVKLLRPQVKLLRPQVKLLRPQVKLLRPQVKLLRPQVKLLRRKTIATSSKTIATSSKTVAT